MSGLATEHLARLDDYLKLVAVVLTIAAALTAAFAWFTGRELEQRRTADSVKMQEQVQTAEQVADRLGVGSPLVKCPRSSAA